MQILNLVNLEKSDIKYHISHFPDGEVQIVLEEFSHKDEVNIKCRITSTKDLFILMQVTDILVRHGMYFSISIYYLMGMRMDRVISFSRPFTLKMIVDILDNLGAYQINIFSPHSDTSINLFRKTDICTILSDEWEDSTYEVTRHNPQILLPDAGAVKRYPTNSKVLIGEKVRDLSTGLIQSIRIKNPEDIDGRPILLIDDLCDGGGTFMGLASAIREIDPNAVIDIIVNHMVNPKGIKNLSETFNHVWFSNSYKDWKKYYEDNNLIFPENITQIEVI